MRRLMMIKSAGEDVFFEFFLRERHHCLGRIVCFEEHGGDFIDPLVRALGGEDHRNEKFIGGPVMQCGAGVGIQPLQFLQKFFHAAIIPYRGKKSKENRL